MDKKDAKFDFEELRWSLEQMVEAILMCPHDNFDIRHWDNQTMAMCGYGNLKNFIAEVEKMQKEGTI